LLQVLLYNIYATCIVYHYLIIDYPLSFGSQELANLLYLAELPFPFFPARPFLSCKFLSSCFLSYLYFCNTDNQEPRGNGQGDGDKERVGLREEYASFSVTHAYKVSARYTDVKPANRWACEERGAGAGLLGSEVRPLDVDRRQPRSHRLAS